MRLHFCLKTHEQHTAVVIDVQIKTYFAPRMKKKKNRTQGKYIAWEREAIVTNHNHTHVRNGNRYVWLQDETLFVP